MDDILGGHDEREMFQKLTSFYDAPAFVRRARGVEDAYRHLLEDLRTKREELLTIVRLRVGQLRALAGDWSAVRPLLNTDADLDALRRLHDELQPRLRLPPEPTTSRRELLACLAELRDAIAMFNRRWHKLVSRVDLTHLNRLRDGYNRYYLVEKECALGSAAVARAGFKKLEPVAKDDLFREFPLLGVPRSAGESPFPLA